MTSGRWASSARSLFVLSAPASSGCRIEYVPADPQQRCASATGNSLKPASSSRRSTSPRICMPCCSVHGGWNASVGGAARCATCGASCDHACSDQFDRIARERRDARGLLRIRGILREDIAVVADHDAAAAGSDDDRLGTLLDVRPPGIDVAPGEHPRFVVLGQVIRQRAATAAAPRSRWPRCRCGRARARWRRRCSARAPAARTLPESTRGANAAAQASRRQPARPVSTRPACAAGTTSPTVRPPVRRRRAASTAARVAARCGARRRPARGRRDRRRTCDRCRPAVHSVRRTGTSSRSCGRSGSDRGASCVFAVTSAPSSACLIR